MQFRPTIAPWLIVTANGRSPLSRMVCQRCGTEENLPQPVQLKDLNTLLDRFAAAHENCQEKDCSVNKNS